MSLLVSTSLSTHPTFSNRRQTSHDKSFRGHYWTISNPPWSMFKQGPRIASQRRNVKENLPGFFGNQPINMSMKNASSHEALNISSSQTPALKGIQFSLPLQWENSSLAWFLEQSGQKLPKAQGKPSKLEPHLSAFVVLFAWDLAHKARQHRKKQTKQQTTTPTSSRTF